MIAVALIFKDDKLFIAKRSESKNFMPGVYELPGGHIEDGETLKQGLKREIFEEFAVEIQVGDMVGEFSYQENDKIVTEYGFEAEAKDGFVPKLNSKDHSEYRWVSKIELAEYLCDNINEYNLAKEAFKRRGLL